MVKATGEDVATAWYRRGREIKDMVKKDIIMNTILMLIPNIKWWKIFVTAYKRYPDKKATFKRTQQLTLRN